MIYRSVLVQECITPAHTKPAGNNQANQRISEKMKSTGTIDHFCAVVSYRENFQRERESRACEARSLGMMNDRFTEAPSRQAGYIYVPILGYN